MIFAGDPPTTVYSGTSLFTMLPAATTLPLPIFTPGKIVTLAPIQTSLPINIGAELYPCSRIGVVG